MCTEAGYVTTIKDGMETGTGLRAAGRRNKCVFMS